MFTNAPDEKACLMKTTIEWIRADERLPADGAGIVAAVTGRYPGEPDDDPDSLDGQEF